MSLIVRDTANSNLRLTGVYSANEPVSFVSCFKLLTGMADIEDTVLGSNVRCRTDFRTLETTRVQSITESKIASGLFGADVSAEDGRALIDGLKHQNAGFFERFLAELTLCLSFSRKNYSTDRFLYFYRTLEYIAIAFPIYYFARRSDFVQSHSFLKDFFSDRDAGELKAIKKLSSFFAEQSDLLRDLTVNLEVEGHHHPVYAAEVVDQIYDRLDPEVRERADTDDFYVALPYKDVAPFLIKCRNLLFHNSNSGQRNFEVARMGGAEALCGALVPAGMTWLSQTFLEIIRDRASRL